MRYELFVFVLAGGIACSSSDAAKPGDAGTSTDASNLGDAGTSTDASNLCIGVEATPECDPATEIADANTLLDAFVRVSEIGRTPPLPTGGAALLPSNDLHFTNAVAIDVPTLRARLPGCNPNDGGAVQDYDCDTLMFGPGSLPGLQCVDAPNADGKCSQLSIAAGTTVRFRADHYRSDQYLGPHAYTMLAVDRCSAPCPVDTLRCAAAKSCVATAAFCSACEGKGVAECLCRDGCGAKPEGTACEAFVSDNQHLQGTCHAGTCK